ANQLLQPYRPEPATRSLPSGLQHRWNAPQRPRAPGRQAFTISPLQTPRPPASYRDHQTRQRLLSVLPHPHRPRRHRGLLPRPTEHPHSRSRVTSSSQKASRVRLQGPTSDSSRLERALINPRMAYGASQGVLRAGANPTGIRATSFSDLISMTETS